MKTFLFVFYLIGVFAVLLWCFKNNRRQISRKNESRNGSSGVFATNYITPIFVFSAAFIAYSSIGIFDRIGNEDVSLYDFFVFVVSNFVGLFFFVVGYGKNNSVTENNKLDLKSLFTNGDKTKGIRITGVVVFTTFLLVALLNFAFVKSLVVNFGSGESYLDYSIRDERTAFGGLIQALKSYFHVLFLLWPFYRCYSKKRIGILEAIIVLLYFSWAFFSGDRTTLILIVIMFAVLINDRFKNFSMKFLIIAAIVGVLGLVMLGHLRRYSSIGEMIEMIQRYGITALIDVTGSGEFKYTTGTLFNYIVAIDSVFDYSFFGVYIVELIMFVPTFIFPNRPLPLAEQYMLDFFPSAPKGTGHGWYILTTGYMAMGILGIALEMFVFGKLVRGVYAKFFEGKISAIHAFLYSYFLLYLFYSVRSSMILSVKNYIINVLPVILIYLLLKKSFDSEARKLYNE